MKKLVEKDKKRRNLVKKYELKRLALKYIILNTSLNSYYRQQAQFLLNALPKNSSKSRLTNRCILSGRAKSVYKDFGLSRIALKNIGLQGMVPGFKKASW
jgi:small subunit ribosomal protein S14